MFITFAPPTAALVALETHAGNDAFAFIATDGPFIAFNFGEDATFDSCNAAIDAAETAIDSLATEAEAAGENTNLLMALRDTLSVARREVRNEYAYIMSAPTTAEATAAEQESQLHADTHAAINDSSSSNDADSKNEELIDNGQATEGTGTRRKR